MKFVGYFWLCTLIAIVVYLSFVGYMMIYKPNHFNAIPENLMERYNDTSKRNE